MNQSSRLYRDIDVLFLELVRFSIGKISCLSHTPSSEEWCALYELAKKQALIGITFYGIQKLSDQIQLQNLPDALKIKWIGMGLAIHRKNELINRRCVELQETLTKNGIRSYIMKGQGNGALYDKFESISENKNLKLETVPLSMFRQPGDIDVFLEGGREKVLEYVNRTFPSDKVNELEIQYKCYPDVEVEVHYCPFIMRNPIKNFRLQKFFAEEGEKCFENKITLPNNAGLISVPTYTFNLVHQLVHIYHHMITGGIGLRQLMDYYMLLKTLDGERVCVEERVRKAVTQLGLDGFASALMWVLGEVFGLEHDLMFWTPNERNGSFVLDEVMKTGNFGHMDETKKYKRNRVGSFFYVNSEALRMARFDPWAWFWTPFWRIYHYIWRKINGYK